MSFNNFKDENQKIQKNGKKLEYLRNLFRILFNFE